MTVLGEDLVEEYKRKLEISFDGWTAPIENEGRNRRVDEPLAQFC